MGEAEQVRENTVDQELPDGALPLIQAISGLLEKRCDRFLIARYGLTMPQFQLLLAAMRGADVTLGGLSDQLNCSRGNVTGIVDRLERDAWLARERSIEDRRVISVRVTEKGQKIFDIQRELDTELAEVVGIWDSTQQETLAGMLHRLYHELKAETEEAPR